MTTNPTPAVREAADRLYAAALRRAATEADDLCAGRLTAEGSFELDYAQDRWQEALDGYVAAQPAAIDAAHLARQREFSERTFGPGPRTAGVVDHIRKELTEIEADPADLGEWVDVIILAFDGAWRAGWEPQQIIDAIVAKQARNEKRVWPDWRTADRDKAIEHDRSVQEAAR